MSIFQRIVMGAREQLAREANLCVLPNEERARIFRQQTQTKKPVECIWNVPSLAEVSPQKKRPDARQPLRLFYGGSLSPDRLPPDVLEVISAFKGAVLLEVVGYPTYSAQDYLQKMKYMRLCKTRCIKYHGTVPERLDLLKIADRCEAALCLMPLNADDINMKTMAGASNKPFDAMARGLAVVVSDLPEWTRMYLRRGGNMASVSGERKKYAISAMGYGIAINPESRESITAGLEWMLANREKLWELGGRGRQKIKNEWNYEQMFTKVTGYLSS